MPKFDSSVPFSGSFAVVVPQKPAQTGVTFDFRRIWRARARRSKRGHADGPVFDSLMRTDGIVVAFVFADQIFQVTFAKNHELIHAFILDGLNKAFRKRVQVWRGRRKLLHLDSLAAEDLVEFLREL